jgi:hypothetical protein
MPNGYDPNNFALKSVKEAVRANHDFSIRQFWKLGKASARVRVGLKPSQTVFCLQSKVGRCRRVITANVRQQGQKLFFA